MWIRVFKIDLVCLRLGPFTKPEYCSDTTCDVTKYNIATQRSINRMKNQCLFYEMQTHISSVKWHSGLGGRWNVEIQELAVASGALTVISSPFFSNVIMRMPCFFPCMGARSKYKMSWVFFWRRNQNVVYSVHQQYQQGALNIRMLFLQRCALSTTHNRSICMSMPTSIFRYAQSLLRFNNSKHGRKGVAPGPITLPVVTSKSSDRMR